MQLFETIKFMLKNGRVLFSLLSSKSDTKLIGWFCVRVYSSSGVLFFLKGLLWCKQDKLVLNGELRALVN
jgi:hypothetical protein